MKVLFSAENCDFWFVETFVKFSGQSDADKSAKLQVGFLNFDIDTVIIDQYTTIMSSPSVFCLKKLSPCRIEMQVFASMCSQQQKKMVL